MSHKTKFLALVAASSLAAAACSESPTNLGPGRTPGPPSTSFAPRTVAPRDVPEVRMDLPPQARSWDTSDSALVAAIAAESGHAVVAIKQPGRARAFQGGVRGAVTAATVEGGLAMLQGRGIEIVELYDAIGAAHVRMNPALAPELRSNPLVDYIEPRQHGAIAGLHAPFSSRPLASSTAAAAMMMAQTVPWGIQLVNAPPAWGITQGAGVKIELIDTGMDTTHEDLPHPPGLNCAGAFGGCDDAFPFPHGTHVLGTWTARNNSVGVVGAAPAINAGDVYVYGACSSQTGSCPTTGVTAGINAAIFTAKVISLSLIQPYDAAQANAVAQAWNNDIVIVAAAGNVPPTTAGTVVYPANYANVIGVSGLKPDKTFASTSPCGISSNYGSHVDLAAPFWALSTVPGGYQNETSGWCGTSMATPHISGVAALVRAARPSWTKQQVVTRLVNTAEDLGAVGRDNNFGNGLVNAYNALTTTLSINGPGFISQKATYTFTAVYSRFNTTPTFVWEEKECDACGWVHMGGSTATYPRTLQPNCSPGWEVYHLRTTATDAWGMSNTSTKDVYLCELP